MFKIIACFNKKRVLGKDGKLLYSIKNDMKNFVSMTKFNGVVVMGRVTYESLPNGEPLKDRVNIILTTSEDFCVDESYENVFIAHSIEDVVNLCNAFFSDKELFVIGGESVYRQFMEANLVDEMRLTIINDEVDGDAKFPEYAEEDWYTYYKSMAQFASVGGVDKSFYFQVLKKKN